MLPQTTANLHQFDDAGLHPVLLENIKLCGYELPTPIQAYAVPAVMNSHDIIAVAQTGEYILSPPPVYLINSQVPARRQPFLSQSYPS